MSRTKAHERALGMLRKAKLHAGLRRDKIAALEVQLERTDKALADANARAMDARRAEEAATKKAAKVESIVADLRKLLVHVLRHKTDRNLAMNEPHHVSLANELAMLRLLINKRGAAVSADELKDFLEVEAKREQRIDAETGVTH